MATEGDVAAHFGLSQLTAVALCQDWVAVGFLMLHEPSCKRCSYRLVPDYEWMIVASDKW